MIEAAKQIVAVNNSHKFVDDIIQRLNWNKDVGLSKIIDLISSTQEWANYISNVNDWLTSKKALVEETTPQEV